MLVHAQAMLELNAKGPNLEPPIVWKLGPNSNLSPHERRKHELLTRPPQIVSVLSGMVLTGTDDLRLTIAW